jgi:hypothetical protein
MSASAHPDFSAPASAETRIWRYLTFAKYIDLVEREEIFFARADRLGDPFEGTLSKANVAIWGKASGDPAMELCELLAYERI